MKWRSLAFVILFAAGVTAFLLPLHYFREFTQLPSGLHFIRQSDGLSFALNYQFSDASFFHPSNFNLHSAEGKAASEFPLLYYIAALLSDSTEGIAFALRVLHALIFFGGMLVSLYAGLKRGISVHVAYAAHLLILLSTVVLYYSNNYLPDIAALGLTLAATSLAYSGSGGITSRERRAALLLFTFAALIKITYAIYPLAWFIGLMTDRAKKDRPGILVRMIFRWCALWIIPVVLWWSYVLKYNKDAGNDYYFNRSIPIWNTPHEQLEATTDLVLHYWKNSYIPEGTQYFIPVAVIVLLVSAFKKRENADFFLPVSFLGVAGYILLFYQKFHDHDYYFLVAVPFLLHLFLRAFHRVDQWWPTLRMRMVAAAVYLSFIAAAYTYVSAKLQNRYQTVDATEVFQPALREIRDRLNTSDPRHHIKPVVIGDSTVNGTLFMLERKGWTLPIVPNRNDLNYWDKLKGETTHFLLMKKPAADYGLDSLLQGEKYPQLISEIR